MKKIILIFIAILIVALLVSCNQTNSNVEVTATSNEISESETVLAENTSILETEKITDIESSETTELVENTESSETTELIEDNTVINEPLPNKSIEIRSIDSLNEMRKMLTCDDESQWNQYIESVSDCGIESKDDILIFVKLIDALPQISILDGDITWIYFSHDISEDTGKEATVVYITTKAKNGDWTRIEYVLSITDVSKKISDERESIGDNSVLNNFVKSLDGDLTLYIETREPHPSDKGTMIQWVGEAKGIFTRIYYYTSNPDNVNTDNLFGNIQIK